MIRSTPSLGLVAGLLASACGSPPTVAIAVPTTVADLQTFVMSVDDGLFVGTSSVAVSVTGVETRAAEIALYTQPIDALGLTPGPQPRSEPMCNSCALLAPSATFSRAPLVGGDWKPQTGLSDALASALVPDAWPRCSCTNFAPMTIEIPAASEATVVAALEETEGSVLLAVGDGTLIRVHPDLRVERLCAPWTPIEHAMLGVPGHLWVASRRAIADIVLADQRADAPCTTATSTTNALIQTEHMQVIGGQPDWLVLVTAAGSVLTFDGQFSPVLTEIGLPSRPVIVSIGPRQAAVAQKESDTLHWIEGRVTHSERIVNNDSIDALALSPEHGLVAVLELAGVAVRAGAAWNLLGIPQWGGSRVIIPYGDGIISVASTIVELSPRLEACADLTRFTGVRAYRIAKLGTGDVVVADITSGEAGPSAIGVLVATPWCTN